MPEEEPVRGEAPSRADADIFSEDTAERPLDVAVVEEEAFEEPRPALDAPGVPAIEELTAKPEPEFEDLRDVETPLAGTTDEEDAPQKKKWRLFRKGGDA